MLEPNLFTPKTSWWNIRNFINYEDFHPIFLWLKNKEFEKKSAEKAKEVEEKLKEQNEEKTDDIEQTKKDIQDTLD